MRYLAKHIYIVFIFSVLISAAQDDVVDSLKRELQKATHDTTRCIILDAILQSELDDNIWPMYNNQLHSICEKKLETLKELSANAPLKAFYLQFYASTINNFGLQANSHGDIPAAIDHYKKSMEILESINDQEGVASVITNIGYIYDKQGDIPKALEYYHKGLAIRESINDKYGIANSLINLSSIYSSLGETEKALEYCTNSKKLFEEIGDKYALASVFNTEGALYSAQKNFILALQCYEKSLALREEIKDKEGIGATLSHIASIYSREGNTVKALPIQLRALAIRTEINDKLGISGSNTDIGSSLLALGRIKEAEAYALKGLEVAQQLGFPIMIKNGANVVKRVFWKQHKFKEAYDMYQLELQMADSIYNEDIKKAALKKQIQYVYEKKAAQDSIKNAEAQKVKNALLLEQEAQLKQEETRRLALYGGMLLVVIFSVFLFNRFKLTQKQNKIIEEQKKEVDLAYEKLRGKNKEVMDSIHYARRIQNSLLASDNYIFKELRRLKKEN